jgi:hypothetical protein
MKSLAPNYHDLIINGRYLTTDPQWDFEPTETIDIPYWDVSPESTNVHLEVPAEKFYRRWFREAVLGGPHEL